MILTILGFGCPLDALDSLAESMVKFFEEDPTQSHNGVEYKTAADEAKRIIGDFNVLLYTFLS
jgi:hypothetical protein